MGVTWIEPTDEVANFRALKEMLAEMKRIKARFRLGRISYNQYRAQMNDARNLYQSKVD